MKPRSGPKPPNRLKSGVPGGAACGRRLLYLAAYDLPPGSTSVPNWKGVGLDRFNPRLSAGLSGGPAEKPVRPHPLTPFLKTSWSPADNSFWSGLAGGTDTGCCAGGTPRPEGARDAWCGSGRQIPPEGCQTGV